jgi:hypothetical protein
VVQAVGVKVGCWRLKAVVQAWAMAALMKINVRLLWKWLIQHHQVVGLHIYQLHLLSSQTSLRLLLLVWGGGGTAG